MTKRKWILVSPKRGITLSDSIPKKELIKTYAACQWWLGKSWLNDKQGKHPMQYLWREEGWASDVELFLIGSAILSLRKQGHKRKDFEGKRIEFLGKHVANHEGYLFELLVSTLFSEANSQVKLLPPSAKCYDLDIITSTDVEIQASCKVCLPSDEHNSFKEYAEIIEGLFTKAQAILNVTGWDLYLQVNNISEFPSANQIQYMLKVTMHNLFTKNKQVTLQCQGNIYEFRHRLPSIAGTLGYSKNIISYNFFAYHSIDTEKEYKRIYNIIKKANKKFKDITISNKQNIIVIKIPRYISIEKIGKYFLKKFEHNFTSTSGIIFIQTHIVHSLEDENVILNTAFQAIYNPNGQYKWDTKEAINLVLPIGQVSGYSPKLVLGNKEFNTELNNESYTLHKCVESYFVKDGYEAKGTSIPGVRRIYQYVMNDRDNLTLEMPSIPFDFKLI